MIHSLNPCFRDEETEDLRCTVTFLRRQSEGITQCGRTRSEDGHIEQEAFNTIPSDHTKQTNILRLMDLWSNSIGPSRKLHHGILSQGNSSKPVGQPYTLQGHLVSFHLPWWPQLLSNNQVLPFGMKTDATKCYCLEHGIFWSTTELYTAKYLYSLHPETILPTGQAHIVVTLTGEEESGTICHMRVQLGLGI